MFDIDGVLAPFGGEHGRHADYVTVDLHPPYSPVYVRRDLPDVMKRLMQTFTIMWGTAWEDEANNYREHFGFVEPLEMINFMGECKHEIGARRLSGGVVLEPGYSTWKLPWIAHFLDNDERPAIWIDDEALDDAQIYAAARTEAGIPTLFIRTEPHIGFIDDHVGQMETWAKEHCS